MWSTFRKELKTRVQSELDSTWKRSMEAKSTLSVYRQSKETRGLTKDMYDNSRGSRLLALARAGMLNTGERRDARDPSADIRCADAEPRKPSHMCFWNVRKENYLNRNSGTDLDFTRTQRRRTLEGRRRS